MNISRLSTLLVAGTLSLNCLYDVTLGQTGNNGAAAKTTGQELSLRPKPLGLTVDQALKRYGPEAKMRIRKQFQRAKATYPPKHTSWICLKQEKIVLIFAKGEDGKMKQITAYPIVASSGALGPKLQEGDLQVPEGFYKPTNLDAGTHLCTWVNYPNRTDQANAKLDHRTKLGGNIQIHEGVLSTGCVVLDHDAMAELFILAHDTGCQNADLIMAPCNLVAKNPDLDFTKQPKWLPKLYGDMKKVMAIFPIDVSAPGDVRVPTETQSQTK
jgi:hypothetical protein